MILLKSMQWNTVEVLSNC